METQILNGTQMSYGNYYGGAMNGSTTRFNGSTTRFNGSTTRFNGSILPSGAPAFNGTPLDEDEYREFLIDFYLGDQVAMNGLFDKFKNRRAAGKAKRKAKKETRQNKRAERKDLRGRRRLARTEAIERGEGFFQKAAGALGNIGEAQKIAAMANADLAAQGLAPDLSADGVMSYVSETVANVGGDAINKGLTEWLQDNWMLVAGIGVALAIAIYFAVKASQKNKSKKRR
jgi:hypothetical protein